MKRNPVIKMYPQLHRKIAVAIRLSSFSNAIKDYILAEKAGADLIEIRFDFNHDLCEYIKNSVETSHKEIINFIITSIFSENEMRKLRDRIKLPIIFTFRRKDQGGYCNIPENIRFEIIRYLLKFNPEYLDLEADCEQQILEEFNDLVQNYHGNLIYSYHDWNETPDYNRILSIAQNIIDRCPSLDEPYKSNLKKNVLKMIFTARTEEDNSIILKVCKQFADRKLNFVCFLMGEQGRQSRVESLIHGAYFSFASIGENTAPGQIKIDEFIQLFSKILRDQNLVNKV